MEKWSSRKLWVTAIAGVLLVLNRRLNLQLDAETVLAVAILCATYMVTNVAAKRTRK